MPNILRLICLIIFGHAAYSQCALTITESGYYNMATMGIMPGQRICIKGGNYQYITINNLTGTAAKPIVITNVDGIAKFSTTSGYGGIWLRNSRYIKLSGAGDSNYEYGINIQGTASGQSAINASEKSSDLEIEKVEVSGSGFAGIMIKTDPGCDPSTWRGNLVVQNIVLHHNYIHDVAGEGFYIGSSFWNEGITVNCNGTNKVVFPHNITGLKIYSNLTERTGADGIQYACSPNAYVYNNIVRDAGVSPFQAYQSNGIQVGGGAGGFTYNNLVINARGNGILLVGHLGGNLVYNNIILNSGEAGFFAKNLPNTQYNTALSFLNNTIVNSGHHSVWLFNDQNYVTNIGNNVLAAPRSGNYVYLEGLIKSYQVKQYTNWNTPDANTAGFVNLNGGDYTPRPGSPLIDAGTDFRSWGIKTDLAGKPRLLGNAVDIGALEYDPSVVRGRKAYTGITGSEELIKNKVVTYPNPCMDQFTLSLLTEQLIKQVTIYNSAGIPVSKLTQVPAKEIIVNMRELPSGLYIFRAIDETEQVSLGKITKQ